MITSKVTESQFKTRDLGISEDDLTAIENAVSDIKGLKALSLVSKQRVSKLSQRNQVIALHLHVRIDTQARGRSENEGPIEPRLSLRFRLPKSRDGIEG